jgi:class 3 adenylate cyclase
MTRFGGRGGPRNNVGDVDRSGRPATRYVQDRTGAYIGYQVTGRGPINVVAAFGHAISIEDQVEGHQTRAIIDALGKIGRVVRLDRRGIGVSDLAPPSTADSWEVWADDALVVLDALGIARAVVFTTDSTAGNSAMLFAATHPERVSHLVLFHPSARFLAADDYDCGVSPEEAERIVAAAFGSLVNDDIRFIEPLPGEADDGFYDWWVRARRRSASPSEVRRIYQNGIQSDLRPILQAIHVPTLVFLRRPNAPISPGYEERVRYVAEHLPNATLVELGRAGSGLAYLGDTDEIMVEIAAFITGDRPVTSSRVLTTVLFTDIADSTRQVSELGDRAWRERLDAHDTLTRAQLAVHGGLEVNTTGDGFLATFDGPARAIACAVALRDAAETLGIAVRTGIHTGEVERRGDDIAGIAVHIGARVAAAARPGEVLVSRTVIDLVAGAGLSFISRGAQTLKGVEGTWELHAVVGTADARRLTR